VPSEHEVATYCYVLRAYGMRTAEMGVPSGETCDLVLIAVMRTHGRSGPKDGAAGQCRFASSRKRCREGCTLGFRA
jgi:hypothetical protein